MASLFAYTARSAEGRFVAGSLQAESREQALAHLRTRTLFVTSLTQPDTPSGVVGSIVAAWPVSASARTAFFRSFATLIRAGVPIRRALEVVVESCRDARLREALHSVSSDIESGSELSAAMARRPGEFPRLFVAMIRAGEIGGALDDILERIATLLERHSAIRKRVRSAMAYPLIVTIAAVALVLFLVGTTVPAFASMFSEMHVPLPWTTRALIATGSALREPIVWLAAALIPVAIAVLVRAGRRVERVAVGIDGVALALPIFGGILRKSLIARFCRTLGALLRSGVPLLVALDAAHDVVENALYAKLIQGLGTTLREGTPLTATLERSTLFDSLFKQLVRVGEETGTLDAMLLRIAEYYELDVETAIAALGSVLEPVLIMGLGALVGFIVASILVPLYSMIGSIR
jgi:type IV pilus assembly protein PilC